MGWLHSVQLGELMIFMWYSLLLVRQQFLSTLYWRSLASIALDVWLSLIMCFSRCCWEMSKSAEKVLNFVQQSVSKKSLLNFW